MADLRWYLTRIEGAHRVFGIVIERRSDARGFVVMVSDKRSARQALAEFRPRVLAIEVDPPLPVNRFDPVEVE